MFRVIDEIPGFAEIDPEAINSLIATVKSFGTAPLTREQRDLIILITTHSLYTIEDSVTITLATLALISDGHEGLMAHLDEVLEPEAE